MDILIMARNASILTKDPANLSDQQKDSYDSAYVKGDIVEVKPTGRLQAQTNGHFVLVRVTGVDFSAWKELLETDMKLNISYQIVSSDQVTDTYQVKFTSPGLKKRHMAYFENEWNASYVTHVLNPRSVTVEMTVYGILTSRGLWRGYENNIAFSEVYNQGDGTHVITANCSGIPLTEEFTPSKMMGVIQNIITDVGFTVDSADILTRTVIFTATRAQTRDFFLAGLKEKLDRLVIRRRVNYFNAADVDAAIAAGGIVTVTETQFTNKLQQKVVV